MEKLSRNFALTFFEPGGKTDELLFLECLQAGFMDSIHIPGFLLITCPWM